MYFQEGDRKARELWNKILVKFPNFFEGLDIKPAIVHGDLWGGNASENDEGPGRYKVSFLKHFYVLYMYIVYMKVMSLDNWICFFLLFRCFTF